ncbi:MAG: nucleotidyltransferase family protein, partial [Dethiobacteria bacterium]|nr:nucleotidyltransferase family protein [Dethiobacteria bacterium]
METGAKLLLGYLRREEESVKLSRLRAYATADWEALLEVAKSHGSGPILYDALKNYAAQLTLSAAELESLRGSYYAAAARNMRLYRQLLDTVALFNRSGLEVILLKGAHLAEAVYGNIALRSMSDVDLLVRQGDLKKVHQLLVSDGYSFAHDDVLSNTKHLAPYRNDKGVYLEIHFHIADPPYADRIKIDQMWNRARADRFQGVDVLTLSHEDLYLHLCLHSALQHGFEMGLVSCLDIAAFIEHCSEDTDWELLWSRGCEWGIERSVYLM